MEPRSGSAPPGVVEPPRQRWRLVLARSLDAPPLAGRELADAWEGAIEASGLPIHVPAGRARGRVAFAAPLPLGIGAERELADVFLSERIPVWRVRDAVTERLPAGWSLRDVFDVWVNGPPLAGRVTGAVYRIELRTGRDGAALESAAGSLLAAATLPRTRQKGEAMVAYDLRPLLLDITMSADGSNVRIHTRIHPELGTGRPEEVIAAIGDALGEPLEVRAIVRERLILAGDPG